MSDDLNMLVPSHSLNSTGSQGPDSIARHIKVSQFTRNKLALLRPNLPYGYGGTKDLATAVAEHNLIDWDVVESVLN